METQNIPDGYWADASGNLVPVSKIKPIDQIRNDMVYELCRAAALQSYNLARFKIGAMAEVANFCALSLDQYG
ncbi:MAG: DUF3164 family protein, partial [Moraxellaceae bacterium]|nr:DUF3164 family protein [Moraxellaceae bacterium]